MDNATPLIDFYLGRKPDGEGRMLRDILDWDDYRLEVVHNYIQWLFPLTGRSAFNARAPILTADDIHAFRQFANLRAALTASFDRLLKFYGFQRDGSRVLRAGNFSERTREWVSPGDHNFLRITRILRSLMILGLPELARAFFAELKALYIEHPHAIGDSFRYWNEAVADDAPAP